MRNALAIAGLLAGCVTTPVTPATADATPPLCDALNAREGIWNGTNPPLALAFGDEKLIDLRRRLVGQALEETAPIERPGPAGVEERDVLFCVRHGAGYLQFESNFFGAWERVTAVVVTRGPPPSDRKCAANLLVTLAPLDELLAPTEALLTARWGAPTTASDDPSGRIWDREERCRCGAGDRLCDRYGLLSGRFVDGRTESLSWAVGTEPL